MLVLGAKEQDEKLIAVRSRKAGDIGQMKLDEFISKLTLQNPQIKRAILPN